MIASYQSSSSSDPLSQPSSYASAISPRELLRASRSAIPIALLTMCCKFLTRRLTVVSVDRDVFTETDDEEGLGCENMRGKLSSRGNGRGIRDLWMSMVSNTNSKEPVKARDREDFDRLI